MFLLKNRKKHKTYLFTTMDVSKPGNVSSDSKQYTGSVQLVAMLLLFLKKYSFLSSILLSQVKKMRYVWGDRSLFV